MNDNNLRIKPIEAAHIGELIQIGEAANLSPWTPQGYRDEMKDPASIMLRLIDEENSIIGFVVGRLILGGEIESRLDAEIYNIAVTEPNRRRGCAQLLFDEFLATCREKQVANIWLEVRESNENAIKFYEKNGFERIRTRPSFYRNPRENAHVMRLILK